MTDTTNTPVATSEAPMVVSEPTKLEAAANAVVDHVAKMRDAWINESSPLGVLIDLADKLEDASARSQASRLSTPRLLEMTGNIAERELAARFMEDKARAALMYAGHRADQRHEYEHMAACFQAGASDFRAGLHLPVVHIEGRAISYNDDNDSGIRHADALRTFFTDVYGRNLKAGWWTDIETGEPKKRNVGELFILFVTEIAEAYDAWRHKAPDDKLGQYPGIGVELADLGIRWADFCGAALAGNIVMEPTGHNPGDLMFRQIARIADEYDTMRKTPAAKGEPETADFLPPMDIAEMTDAKLAFNAHRPDHKIENRLKEDGKRT